MHLTLHSSLMTWSSLSKKTLGLSIVASQIVASFSHALRLSIPPSDGFRDIAVTGPQHIESNGDLVYNYIQLANQYLRASLALIAFIAVVYVGFKFLTSSASDRDEAKTALKNVLINAGVGILIVMMSYTIVRLIINIL